MQTNDVMIHKKFKKIILPFNKQHAIPVDWDYQSLG